MITTPMTLIVCKNPYKLVSTCKKKKLRQKGKVYNFNGKVEWYVDKNVFKYFNIEEVDVCEQPSCIQKQFDKLNFAWSSPNPRDQFYKTE